LFVSITNTPRDYAWGWAGAPEAELWLGAHPGSPSPIIDPSETGGVTDLAQWVAADPDLAFGQAPAR
jgi:mannose-6-phosphate isomerase